MIYVQILGSASVLLIMTEFDDIFYEIMGLIEMKIIQKVFKSRLKVPFCKTTMRQKSPSYIGPSVWNKLPSSMKINMSLNKFKHDAKKHYLRELRV